MKTFKKFSCYVTAFSLVIGLFSVLGLVAPVANAATSPSLATAANFSILAGSEVTNTGATTISADVGISPGIGVPPHYTGFGTVTLGGTIEDANGTALSAQGDKDLAYAALSAQGCNTTYIGAFKELAGETLVPGVYCADSFHLSSGTLTLDGDYSDVWVFKSASDLIITDAASEVVFLGNGQPCNVWWQVVSTATFDAGSSFVGNILASTSITFAAGASLDGRALAGTAEVTMDSTSISGPTCLAAPAPGGTSGYTGTINVVKTVINDNGRTNTVTDFPLFINGISVLSGITNNFSFSNSGYYNVTETTNPNYTRSFSGDCDVNGVVYLNPTENKFCIVTNNDIGAPVVIPPVPPIIDVVKVPNPLSLPAGPGPVTYTYTLRNIGTVPVTNLTMVGDTCSPIVLASGDTNSDAILGLTETWIYNCTTTLTETHTNTVVATGWANGISATDIASATVIVGLPLVPPLIHVTKVPSPLTLLAGGGAVTYTEKITNPGTVALNNVRLTDDKCSPMNYVSGDTNGDVKLDTTETWTYTCRTNLTSTTVNTATAVGEANGYTVRDFAIATVTVATAAPALPQTGSAPMSKTLLTIAIGLLAVSSILYFAKRKQTV
ncbi:MAG: hypothetical protein ACD_76C00025G0003 [uncultured bacterium]|nr:MAG: hypothetical protein ACD_76C00025G0003 [uncultured bacterium]HBD05092.1 hypothetical protein [Candidatus Uhrbacteria bacterium]